MNEKSIIQQHKKRKANATKRGVDFTIDTDQLKSILETSRCYYINTPLNVRSNHFKGITGVTIDRIDNNKGYIPGNVCASSNIANQMKNMCESGLIVPEDIINFGKKLKLIL